MSQRLLPIAVVLLLVSCLAGPPPPSAAAPTAGGSSATGAGCGQFNVTSKADLESCKNKCRDQERDQLKACTGQGCQGGAGTAACLGSCDDRAKAAQQGKCFKDQ
jgi:hypothetical protein